MNFSRLVIFLTCWNFIHARKKPALVFDWEEEKLVEMSKDEDEAIYKFCISACPAASNSPSEKLLNDKVSITKKSLFLRDVYSEKTAGVGTSVNEMEIEICETAFTPGLAWNYELLTYDVGYELYYKEDSIKSKISTYDFYNDKDINGKPRPECKKPPAGDLIKIDRSGDVSFNMVADLDRNLVIPQQETESSSSKNSIKISKSLGNMEFQIVADPEKKLNFYWIQVLSLHISNNRKHGFFVFYGDKITDYSHKVITIHHCETYFTVDGTIELFDTKPLESKKLAHLVKTQILPMRMFHSYAARLATCVYLNFAFIWDTIANETLKKIDSFLYAIHQEKFWGMDIFFGVYSSLPPELNPIIQEETASEDIRFHFFSIPQVVFRLVEICGIDGKSYSAVIVLHNDLEPIKDADRICSTQDEVPGWEDIKNTNCATGLSYTCPQTKDVLMKLGFDEEYQNASTTIPLKLKEFPHMNAKTKKFEYINVLDTVKNRLERFEKLKIED